MNGKKTGGARGTIGSSKKLNFSSKIQNIFNMSYCEVLLSFYENFHKEHTRNPKWKDVEKHMKQNGLPFDKPMLINIIKNINSEEVFEKQFNMDEKYIIRVFPEKAKNIKNDIKIVKKDHPGYSTNKVFRELWDRYTYDRKKIASK